MKAVDRWLQRWRIARAARFLPERARVLDVGCYDGALFQQLGARLAAGGVGMDPRLERTEEGDGYRLLKGRFPDDLGDDEVFDAITMTAVLEHVVPEEQAPIAAACARFLRPGGRLVITTPAPLVDRILDFLSAVRAIDGMSLEQHYGFEPEETPGIFTPQGLELVVHRRFQLGLNHLFVFEKPSG